MYDVTLEEKAEQSVALVRGRVGTEGLPEFLGGAFGEVMQTLTAQRMAPCGPPFGRYVVTDDGFEVEAGFPCRGTVVPAGRVEAGTLAGGPAAVVVHRGPYETVGAAYDAAGRWLVEQGYEPAGAAWESYLDPPEVPEPRTLVVIPCRRA